MRTIRTWKGLTHLHLEELEDETTGETSVYLAISINNIIVFSTITTDTTTILDEFLIKEGK
jgi:hypothetical protein